MRNITYEQFKGWCEHWNYTIEEGFTAMCFVANILGQNAANHLEYSKTVETDSGISEAFKDIVKSWEADAIELSSSYNKLENGIYRMLEEDSKAACGKDKNLAACAELHLGTGTFWKPGVVLLGEGS